MHRSIVPLLFKEIAVFFRKNLSKLFQYYTQLFHCLVADMARCGGHGDDRRLEAAVCSSELHILE